MTEREHELLSRLYEIAREGLGITNQYFINVTQDEWNELEAIRKELLDRPVCDHRLVDARNQYVKSGYWCPDCGAVFRSGDH